jgi:hypothetical protein
MPEDIAGPVVFFAGDDSAWCTGALLVVDSGVSVNLQQPGSPRLMTILALSKRLAHTLAESR